MIIKVNDWDNSIDSVSFKSEGFCFLMGKGEMNFL